MISIGLEQFALKQYRRFRGLRLGLLCNQASVNRQLIHATELLSAKNLKLDLRVFFGPQHGIRGEKQDNMVESDDFVDRRTNIPVISLYSKSREPTPEQLSKIDVLLIDLQDIGSRIYTFIYTMANCMKVAQQTGTQVVVLDRPNPIGGARVDGNILEAPFRSFVGQYPIASQHGMTIGELALLFNYHFKINCDLKIIRLRGWDRKQQAHGWGRDWIVPSPNIPTPGSAQVFPASVFFEGTEMSEGRGTTKPFEWIGAPFIDPDELAAHMNRKMRPGVHFRPIYFQPTFHKYKETICGGVQIHAHNPSQFRATQTGVDLLYTIRALYADKLRWKQPPYEYEHEKLPIDLIAGTDRLRLAVDRQAGLRQFNEWSESTLADFRKIRKDYLLY